MQITSVEPGSSDGLIVLDEGGFVVYANEAAHEILLPDAGSMVGRPFGLPLVANYRAHIEVVGQHGAQEVEMSASKSLWNGQMMEVVILRPVRSPKSTADRPAFSALHDPLTGVGNRLLLAHMMERLGQKTTPTAFLLIDLDKFKQVNDTLGHPAGDALLKEIAHRLVRAVPREATVCRLGGDEFAVLLRGARSVGRVVHIAHGILESLGKPIQVADISLIAKASIGVSLSTVHGRTFEEMLAVADRALYKSKALGGMAVVVGEVGSPAEREIADTGSQILRHASQSGELELFFQPQKFVGNRNFVACETLLRWRHPIRGLLNANQFLTTSRDQKLLRYIDQLVFDQLARNLQAWNGTGLRLDRLSLNLTLPSLIDDGAYRSVQSLTRLGRQSRTEIEVEVSERLEMLDEVVLGISRLKTSQVRVVLDDFGAGNTTLDWLHRLPLDGVKVDRGIIQSMSADAMSQSIAETVIRAAREKGLTVLAEGVETADQYDAVILAGFDGIQGYFIARPMSGDNLHRYVRRLRSSISVPTKAAVLAPPSA
ncbi:MAG: EAL domain-containing protein [Fimbriimonadaceae bacterium]